MGRNSPARLGQHSVAKPLSRRHLERGAFTSTGDLETAILAYIAETPFAKSWGGQSPAIGMGEAVEREADRGQGDHRLGALR